MRCLLGLLCKLEIPKTCHTGHLFLSSISYPQFLFDTAKWKSSLAHLALVNQVNSWNLAVAFCTYLTLHFCENTCPLVRRGWLLNLTSRFNNQPRDSTWTSITTELSGYARDMPIYIGGYVPLHDILSCGNIECNYLEVGKTLGVCFFLPIFSYALISREPPGVRAPITSAYDAWHIWPSRKSFT